MSCRMYIAIITVLSVAWHADATVKCTVAGRFPDPADSTCKSYTLCVYVPSAKSFVPYDYVCPGTSIFNPKTAKCTASGDFVCKVTPTTQCTAEGYFADPAATSCSSYIQCVLVDGQYLETIFTCPSGTLFNPTTSLCEVNYVCAFACTAAGRFANTADATCQSYFFCVLGLDGKYTQYQYTCPGTSAFSPTGKVCTTTYTCPNSG